MTEKCYWIMFTRMRWFFCNIVLSYSEGGEFQGSFRAWSKGFRAVPWFQVISVINPLERSWNPLKLPEILLQLPWNPLEYLEIPWNTHGTPWNPVKHLKTPRTLPNPSETPWNAFASHWNNPGCPCNAFVTPLSQRIPLEHRWNALKTPWKPLNRSWRPLEHPAEYPPVYRSG